MRNRKMIVITGGTGGIGYELAKKMVEKNCAVVIASRSRDKGLEAVRKIQRLYPEGYVDFMTLDLKSRKSIQTFAKKYKYKYTKINVLVNNAGVMCPKYTLTENDQELQFDTNHLGHFYLNKLLFDIIDEDNGRIVTVTSIAANRKEAEIRFDDIAYKTGGYKPFKGYCQSKLANALYGFELSRRLKGTGLKSVVVHPGVSDTDLFRNFPKIFQKTIPFIRKMVGITPPAEAMQNVYYAAVDENVENGDYIGPSSKNQWHGKPTKLTIPNKLFDPIVGDKLWNLSSKKLRIDFLKDSTK